MTFITWTCLRCVQELATILGLQNPTQRSCALHPQQQPAAATAVGGGVVNVGDDAATAAHNITVVRLGESDGGCSPS